MGFPRTGRIPESVLKIVDAAADLQQAGEHEKSLALLLSAEQQTPDYVPLLMLLSVAHYHLGQSERAADVLLRVLELEPRHPEALLSLGMLFAGKDDHSHALPYLERCLDLEPLNVTALRAYSRSLTELERAEEAIARVEHAWHASGDPQVGILLAEHLSSAERLDQAEGVLLKVAETSTDDDLSVVTLIPWNWPDENRRFLLDKLVTVLRRVVTSNPHATEPWRTLSIAQHFLRRDADAMETARRAVELNPDAPCSWLLLAEDLLGAGDAEEALDVVETGLALPGTGSPADQHDLRALLLTKAEALVALGQHEAALAATQEIQSDWPQFGGSALKLKAEVLVALNRPEEALRALEEAAAANTDRFFLQSLQPLRYLTLHVLDRPDEALRVLEADADRYRYLERDRLIDMAMEGYRQGRVAVALSMLEQLHSLAPDELHPLIELSFVLVGSGEMERARAYLKEAVEWPDIYEERSLILTHLAYLELVEGKCIEARQRLMKAGASLLSASHAGDHALLHVAYWWNGALEADSNRFPVDELPVRCAHAVNLLAARLAVGETDRSLAIGVALAHEFPSEACAHRALACARLAAGDGAGAAEALHTARKLVANEADRHAIDRWLRAVGAPAEQAPAP